MLKEIMESIRENNSKKPNIKTKNQLKKDLKSQGELDYTSIDELEFSDEIIWKTGNANEAYSQLTDKAFEKLKDKFEKIKADLLEEFSEFHDNKKFKELVDYHLEEISHTKEANIKTAMFNKVIELYDDITLFDLEEFNIENGFNYEKDAKESISSSGGTSTWTYTAKGFLTFKSGKRNVEIKYNQKSNRF